LVDVGVTHKQDAHQLSIGQEGFDIVGSLNLSESHQTGSLFKRALFIGSADGFKIWGGGSVGGNF